jgi:hypothetical protein
MAAIIQAPTWFESALGTPVSERVIEDIAATLRQIKRAVGFYYDVKYVARFKGAAFDFPDNFPVIIISGWKEDFTAIRGGPDRYNVVLTATMQAWLANDGDNMETPHRMLQRDIIAALMIDHQRGGIARDTSISGTELIPAAGDFLASSLISVEVTYQIARLDPTRPF